MASKTQIWNNLGRLQKRIILCLAEMGPQTINETKKNIPKMRLAQITHYKPTWLAFNSLEEKRLIQAVGIKNYRGRQYPEYWLTQRGVMVALLNKANMDKVEQTALEIEKNDKERKAIEILFDVAEKGGPKIANILFKFLLQKDRLSVPDLLIQLLPELSELNYSEIKEVFKVAKKYPEYWKLTDEKMEKMGRVIDRLRKE